MRKRLFVGNLSWNTTESELQAAFEPYGCTSVAIPTNETGRPRGFGFVEVPADQADAAITAMNGKELHGRVLNVNEARPREERGGFGGGYGGGNRQRSGGRRGGYNDRW